MTEINASAQRGRGPAIRQARLARVRTIRRRAIAGALSLFVATWLLIAIVLATGHDPALSRKTAAVLSSAGSTGSSQAVTGSRGTGTGTATTDSGTSTTGSGANTSGSGSTGTTGSTGSSSASSGSSSSGSTGSVTTRQS